MNVVVLQGRLSRPAEERVLGSGSRLVALEVTVPRPGERADTVPVSWVDPPPAIALLGAGEEVVVVGRVRRRFFRTAAGTASRTEVAARVVVPARQAKRAAAALTRAVEAIESG
jgi:single-strand DNA-binding protein